MSQSTRAGAIAAPLRPARPRHRTGRHGRPRRVAGPGRLGAEPRARARHDAALRHRRAGARGHARGLALPPLAQHRRARRPRLEVPLRGEAGRPTARLPPHGLRRPRLGGDQGALELAAPGLRQADLPQHALPVGPRQPAAAHDPARLQPRGLLPHDVRRPRRVGGPPGVPALRGRQQRLPPVGERPLGGLQRGQHDGRRVRRHALPEGGREPPRRPGLPVVGRELPRGPGHLAPLRHLPRRLPLLDPGPPHLRLRRAHEPRRGLPGRRAARPADGCAPTKGRPPRASRSRRSCSTPTAGPSSPSPWRRTRRRSSTRSTRSATRTHSACSRRR